MAEIGYIGSYASTGDTSQSDPAAVSFISKYVKVIHSLDYETSYLQWYAKDSVFYNGDGKVYNGGETIWKWIVTLFGSFKTLNHRYKTLRVIKDTPDTSGRICDLLVWDVEIEIELAHPIEGEVIVVPRLMLFFVGPAVEGAGTDGLIIYEGKAFWDTNVLAKEVERRKSGAV
ncbi:hypothetical protein EJ05DRAFT_476603 [Pseudovirgaria hyperparasitica]|uniref:SnoaL-like domain-containing protein n=1 Tax=Pseudovirgaria hyperparasitica TaxID=470096 RepID=A0A6A6W309_9PEZI|nr:uncharacterized protein EJ05DRAFT_476603 [Pseudovirgaria hyperparasitica]KAF2757328.1 hypothetical protein EJ05DRAFT_476603 [Pseudovirgaria hyperparasitica]